MIERSFVMLPGIGLRTERSLWMQGIDDWSALLRTERVRGISGGRLRSLKSDAALMCDLQKRGRLGELSEHLPPGERWRLLHHWDGRFAAIDIEVAGEGREVRPVMMSVIRGFDDCRTFVSGDDLSWRSVGDSLRGVDFIVTYNGSSFDLPVLARNGFPVDGHVHIDLRRYAARAGLPGGLKRIEPALGIHRPREVEFSTSEQVSYLWRLWEERGSKNALDLLTRYNQQDAATLVKLSEYIYDRLSGQSFSSSRGTTQ